MCPRSERGVGVDADADDDDVASVVEERGVLITVRLHLDGSALGPRLVKEGEYDGASAIVGESDRRFQQAVPIRPGQTEIGRDIIDRGPRRCRGRGGPRLLGACRSNGKRQCDRKRQCREFDRIEHADVPGAILQKVYTAAHSTASLRLNLHDLHNRERQCHRRWLMRAGSFAVTAVLCATTARGQEMPASDALSIGAHAVGVVTRESPAIRGRDLTEGYLTQPIVMLGISRWGEALALKGTLNFEGATIERGELTAGIYGEGYIDRRHPHTYVHELVLSSAKRFRDNSPSGVSLTAGKGFAPFGTDDPMARPFEKYPINHHLSQILERAVAIGALRAGRWIFEAGAFNGDEPTGPGDVPDTKRYFDSWSGRVTFVPWPQGEFQTSYARVKSPEDPSGVGADQRKQSASVRLEDAQHSGYALIEWSRTSEYSGAVKSFTFSSFLAETWAKYDRISGALRIERTERP